MGAADLGSPFRTVCQIVDESGKPAQATLTSNLWELDDNAFSQKTKGNLLAHFTTGKEYFEDFVKECRRADEEICILGWQVNWDALLAEGTRLYDVLRGAAARGVYVYVMPWCHSNPVQTYDYQTEIVLNRINNELGLSGDRRRVYVLRVNSRANVNVRYFSHHQKQVIIDRKIAYVGGMDLCYGRYDDAKYDLHPDACGRQAMNRYNPCIPARQVMTLESPLLADPDLMSGAVDKYMKVPYVTKSNAEREQGRIERGAWQVPYKDAGTLDTVANAPSIDSNAHELLTLDPACQPRMPWQDVHCRIEGPAVSDLLRNFVVRWNSSGGKRLAMPEPPSAYPEPGKINVQVLRSAPAGMGQAEAELPDNPRKNTSGKEDHIKRAMLRLIEKAHSFIYIENQFFVSAFGTESIPKNERLSPAARFINGYYGTDQNASARNAGLFNDNKKWFSEDKKDLLAPPANEVCQALVQRIQRAILDDQRRPFHVYITLPVHPEGPLAKASIAVQVYWTMQSIAHGSHSLINGIRRALKARDLLDNKAAGSVEHAITLVANIPTDELDPEDERWKEYLTILNLRNWSKLGDRYVTEQIYVHSKLLIVDDLYVLLGSANINDRSLLGERDSEIAVQIMDESNALAEICEPGKKAPVRLFARKLRMDIWKKLFGITGGIRPATHLQAAIEAPGDPDSWKAIQAQAEKNAAAYEAAFPFVPRNWVMTKDKGRETASIIPNWDPTAPNPKDSRLRGFPSSRLPFEPEFWSAPQHNPTGVSQLESTLGFITALPVHWLQGENVRFVFPTELIVNNRQPQYQPELKSDNQVTQADALVQKSKA